MDLESRYELLEKIGAGSFATVFRARDRELGREVAVKQIHEQFLAEPKHLDRYWQEAQLLASLQHPNIVTIFDIYRDRGWLILELMQGNLAERMEGRQMDLRALRTALAHCLRALKYLHSRGVVHGDIKPGNLMIDARKRVKLGDFGLARRVSDDEGSLLKGTTKYMAPEVVSEDFGEVGPASDLYSLGFTAYELMCGPNFESLFPGLSAFGRNKQVAWMMWHAARDRRLPEIGRVLEGVPDDLRHVIQKLVEKDQSKRYRNADDALSDLNIDIKVVQKGGGDEESEAGESKGAAASRKRTIIAACAFGGSLLMSLALLFLPSGGGKPGVAAGPKVFHGLVREVNAEAGTIVVEDDETGTPREIEVARTPKIFLLNKKQNILLRQVEPKDRVEIPISADGSSGPVAQFKVSHPDTSYGRVRSINAQTRQIVIGVEEGDTREEVPIRVPERAGIKINGADKPLRDVAEGDSVAVKHFPDLSGQGVRLADEVAVRRLTEAVGFVGDVDAPRKRLTIRFGAGAVADSRSLPIAADCEIVLKAKTGGDTKLSLEDLVRDDRIRVAYDTEFRQIVVTRDAKKMSAIVKETRPATRELVVTTSTGKEVAFRIDATVEKANEVTLDKDAVTLADLRLYDVVEIAYDDESTEVPVASSVYAIRRPRNDRWAVLVGGEVYEDKFLTTIPTAIDDAELLYRTLRGRYAMGEDRIKFLKDETGKTIQSEIERFLGGARSGSQMVVYLSGHAYKGDDGQVYIAGKDLHYDKLAETGVPLEWVVTRMDACASQDKILLLDLSRKGVGRDLEKQPSNEEMVQSLKSPPKSTVIIAGCAAGQRGLLAQDRDNGVFARALADAFSGNGDADRDLHLTAGELFNHLKVKMEQMPADGGGRQSPVLFEPKGSSAAAGSEAINAKPARPEVRLAK
ncbi:MAG: serine/threonine protein kinase [Planctomycetaceae bacterium]|nr:serine/threonine protein kinase [Planctomycetaceae bacterium]